MTTRWNINLESRWRGRSYKKGGSRIAELKRRSKYKGSLRG